MSDSNKTTLWFFDRLIYCNDLDGVMDTLLSDFCQTLKTGDPLDKITRPEESYHYYQFQEYHKDSYEVIYLFNPDSIKSKPEYHGRELKKDLKVRIKKEYRNVLKAINAYLEQHQLQEIRNFLNLQLIEIKKIKESLDQSDVLKFYPDIRDIVNNLQEQIEERFDLYSDKEKIGALITEFANKYASRNDVDYGADDIQAFLLLYENNKSLSVSDIIRIAKEKREKFKNTARGTFDGWIKNWKDFLSNAQQNS